MSDYCLYWKLFVLKGRSAQFEENLPREPSRFFARLLLKGLTKPSWSLIIDSRLSPTIQPIDLVHKLCSSVHHARFCWREYSQVWKVEKREGARLHDVGLVATATGPEHDIKLFQVNSDPWVEQPAWVPTGVTWQSMTDRLEDSVIQSRG